MSGNHLAAWAGVAAFFGSLLAIGALDLLDPARWAEYLSSIVVAAITAGAVYARQRFTDEKAARERAYRRQGTL